MNIILNNWTESDLNPHRNIEFLRKILVPSFRLKNRLCSTICILRPTTFTHIIIICVCVIRDKKICEPFIKLIMVYNMYLSCSPSLLPHNNRVKNMRTLFNFGLCIQKRTKFNSSFGLTNWTWFTLCILSCLPLPSLTLARWKICQLFSVLYYAYLEIHKIKLC